jgi:hypothetical protein
MSYFIVLLLCCLSGLIEVVPRYYLPLSGIMRFALYLESLLFSLPFFMLTVYLLHYSGENVRRSRLLYAAAVLWAVYLVLLTFFWRMTILGIEKGTPEGAPNNNSFVSYSL